ncbi:MAG: N-acetylmuramoyl-L-alanine amidase [Flavobacteriales bacterium]|nr:N-acetylmuramoyl-L-alanine amidase [Flavobacteriales bacterium]
MPQPVGDPNKIDVIVLDAGHGGKDPGNLGTGRYTITEKDIALNVTLLVGKYIKEAFPDVKVIYTRDDDSFVELRERTRIANRNNADLFISIHCNSNKSRDPYGADTYVMGLHKTQENMKVAQKENSSILLEEGHEMKYDGYDPNDPESMIALSLRQNAYIDQSLLLSALVQDQFRERVGRKDRGVKQAGFLVISYTTMPSILIELGFLTNANEEDFLQSAKGQDYMASAIYRAFKEYKRTVEGVDVSTEPTEVPPANAPPVTDTGVRFKVQVVTASKPVTITAKNFKGLTGVEEHQGAGLFKYTVGNEASLEAAREVQRLCREKGYDGAFIVAFKDGARIDLQEAVKLAQGQSGSL